MESTLDRVVEEDIDMDMEKEEEAQNYNGEEEEELNILKSEDVAGSPGPIAETDEYEDAEGDEEEAYEHDSDEEEGDDDEEDGDRRTNGREEDFAGSKYSAYQNPLCKPIAVIGRTTLGHSTARLFGIKVDSNGNLQNKTERKKTIALEHIKNISRPREIDLSEIHRDPSPTFQPSKTKEALNAMRNKKCGYDFIERLNDRGDFMDRMHQDAAQSKGKLSKWEFEALKNDYEARHDKLMCPNCRKPQSFDEFFEKKRNCSQCQKKFEKLNVTSGLSYLKRVQVLEEKRLKKLREVEKVMYGNKANYLSPFEESSKKKSDAAAANAVPVTVKGGMGRGPLPISRESSGKPFQIKVSRDGIYRKYDSKENEKEEDEKNDDEIDAMVQSLLRKQRKADAPASEGEQRHKPQEIIRKISAMNKAKTDLIDRTLTDLLKNTQQQKPPEGGSSNGRPSSAPAARRREAPSAKSGADKQPSKRDDISKKFQKLVAT